MKRLIYLFVALMISQNVLAQTPFITRWKTDNLGTSNSTSITIPTTGTGYNYDVDWNNDGTFEQLGVTGNVTHNYGTAGTYTVAIRGAFPRIFFNFSGDRLKLLSIEQWGDIAWTSMSHAFDGCHNMVLNATDVPNTAAVTDMSSMFYYCSSFNQALPSGFNTSAVTDMSNMFAYCGSYNKALPSSFNTSNVMNMQAMFQFCSAYNQALPSSFNTSNVTNMNSMFYACSAFNQNIGNLNIGKATNMSYIFFGSGISRLNYDAILIAWDAAGYIGKDLGYALPLTYCNGQAARTNMITNKGWTISGDANGCLPFITRWKTDNTGSSNSTSITIPTTGTGYSYDVDWENDGTFEQLGVTGNVTHDYGTAGTYTVAIRGVFPRIFFNNTGDRRKLLSIEQWGDIVWGNMARAFTGCENMVLNATDVPNTAAVTDMSAMFLNCFAYNQALPSGFNTSNVTNMSYMFAYCYAYNQALPSSFNTSNVTNMSYMFQNCYAYNQVLPSSFNTSAVTNMRYMFDGCGAYNQALPSSFNTSAVTNMRNMFSGCSAYNQALPSSFNTAAVTSMISMFQFCSAFNQNIGNLNIGNATYMDDIFNYSGISRANYDAILIAWDAAGYTNKNLGNASPLTYCNGQAARTNMINTKGWAITGDANVCLPFITRWKTNNTSSGSSNSTSITIPTTGTGYNYDVDWENDGTFDNLGVTGSITHDYGTVGTYTVAIRGAFPRIYFNYSGDRFKFLSIEQWGEIVWTSMAHAFAGCANMVLNATDVPNTAAVTDMSAMFWACYAFNQALPSGFNTAAVTDMSAMFLNCYAYNQALPSSFNTSNVTNMNQMFANCNSYNQALPSGFNTSNVTNMYAMFSGCTAFNQNIGNLNIGKATNMSYIFNNSGISRANYDAILIAWDAAGYTNKNLGNASPLTYCAGQSARANMITNKGWAITGDAKGCVSFITRWKTDNVGSSSNTSITIPTTGTGYNYDVDWNNDGTFDNLGVTGDITHDYGIAGTYTVAIRGVFPRIYFNNSGDKLKLLSIEQWGEIVWASMARAFHGCTNMVLNATDVPNTAAVTDMNTMFSLCSSFNQALPNGFNTSAVTNMGYMFYGCRAYNQALPSSFNTSNVTDMEDMFYGCSAFNQALPSSFNTSAVTNMRFMFQNCVAYNQALPNSFNTSNVTNMYAMFYGCTAFNQNIGGLNIANATEMRNIFINSGISLGNYDAILIAWDAAGYTNKNLGDASPLTYCAGQAARTNMITNKGWAISGDVSTAPTLTLGTIPAICSGAMSFSIPYTASTNSPTTYSISGTGITAVTDGALPNGSITVNLSAAASGSSIPFTLTVKNANGCSSADITGSVTVSTVPTLTLGTIPAICSGATSFSIPYTATTNSPTTYSISGAGITAVTDATLPNGSITVNLSAAASGTSIPFTLTVKNANGCGSANITGSVTVNALPTLTLGTIPAICSGATSFSIPYTASTGTPTTYSISGTGITAVTNGALPSGSITVNLSAAASGTSIPFTLTVRNASGCSSANITGSVTVSTVPTLTLGTIPTICSGAMSFSIPYTATTNSPTTYSISGTGITAVTNGALPSGSITVNLSAAASGTSIPFTLTVKNANGCVSADITGSVTVNALPTLTIGTIPAICSGAMSFSIPYTASTGTPTTYSISGTGITAVTDGALPSGSITVNLSAAASGSSIPFTLTVKNANGCVSANITGSVTVNTLPTITTGAATNPSLCGGTDGSIAFTTNLANSSYTLNYKKGLVSLSSSINVSANGFILSGLMQGSYSEFFINNAGCIGMDATNRDLTEPPSPTVAISANPGNFIASGAIVAFTATPTNGGSNPSYQWKKNGNNVGTNSNQYIDAALNSNDQVWCLMTSNDVCASPVTATSNVMTINACPTAVNWTNQTVTSNQWLSVAYGTVGGNSLFVAVGNTGANRVMTSPDGITWTARTAAASNTWQSVTYGQVGGNGLFVAVAQDSTNRVMTSPDGIIWTARMAAAANTWQSVTYGNNLFVAVARNGVSRVMTSPDGITWTSRTAATANLWQSVTYGNNLFVAVSRDNVNRVMTSPDGITWTARTAAAANEWQSVSYGTVAGNPLFVAVSSTGSNRVMTSPDGINWTSQATPTTNQWRSVAYGIGLYVAVADDGANRVMTSPDGMNWTSQLATQQSPWLSVTYGNGLFVAVAPDGTKRVMTSGFKIQLPITTDITMGSVSYTAGTIIASNQVTNSNVTYTASQSVMLLPGFEAESTVFKAQIAGCPN